MHSTLSAQFLRPILIWWVFNTVLSIAERGMSSVALSQLMSYLWRAVLALTRIWVLQSVWCHRSLCSSAVVSCLVGSARGFRVRLDTLYWPSHQRVSMSSDSALRSILKFCTSRVFLISPVFAIFLWTYPSWSDHSYNFLGKYDENKNIPIAYVQMLVDDSTAKVTGTCS